jgi:hypothetical protein
VKPGLRMKATISSTTGLAMGLKEARFMQALAGYLEKPMLMLVWILPYAID